MRNLAFALLLALMLSAYHTPRAQLPQSVPTEIPALQPLPEPFRLEDAVRLSLAEHPAVRRARAEQAQAEAERRETLASRGFTATAEAHARYITPNEVAGDQSHDDGRLTLSLRKPLYDFGRTGHALRAAETEYRARGIGVRNAETTQRLNVLRRYFDVVEADLALNIANEGAAIAFIRWGRLQDRRELKQVSDIDVGEANAEFHRWQVRVREAETRQRGTRALLANAFNRPTELPSTVEPPLLKGNVRILDTFEALLEKALRHNLELQALQRRLQAAGHQLQSAEAAGGPSLSAQFDTGVWNRNLGGRDEWAAGLVLKIPLFTGGRTDALAHRRRAEIDRLQADLDAASLRIRQQVLEAWIAVDVARARLQESRALLDYRDLYLDRSRTLYELEVRTDLGDAMTRWSEARLAQAKAEHELTMAFARLDALTGEPIIERLLGKP